MKRLSKYRIKWNFATIGGWQKKQQTVIAKNKSEAIKRIYPFNPDLDKIISITKMKM